MASTLGVSPDPGTLAHRPAIGIRPAFLDTWEPIGKLNIGNGPLLIVFFRGFWCDRCQAQLDELARQIDSFLRRGTTVVAISTDSAESSQERIQDVQLAFPVLVDAGGELIRSLDLVDPLEKRPTPVSLPAIFLLDAGGVVRFFYVGESPDDRPRTELLLLGAERLAGGRQ